MERMSIVPEKREMRVKSGGKGVYRKRTSTCIRKWVYSILVVTLFFWGAISAHVVSTKAATFDDINQSEVFLNQEGKSACTLCASAMMLRRAAMMSGNGNWRSITESSLRSTAWINGSGLRWSFSYAGISVRSATLPTGQANINQLINLLNQHPEGIVLHYSKAPHAVLLTDYTDGTFYCSDPLASKGRKRIPLVNAYKVSATNATRYWYVISPDCHLEQNIPQPAPVPEEDHSISSYTITGFSSVKESVGADFSVKAIGNGRATNYKFIICKKNSSGSYERFKTIDCGSSNTFRFKEAAGEYSVYASISNGFCTCEGSVGDGSIEVMVWKDKVESVLIRPKKMFLDKIGETSVLEAVISPDTADNKKVSWSSNRPAVVTVDDNGMIQAKGYGTAVITVTTEDGKFTCDQIIKVNPYGMHYGDLDQDGIISTADLTMLRGYLYEGEKLSADSMKTADLDGDGKVNETDLGFLRKFLYGVIDSFPVENTIHHISIAFLPEKLTYYVGEPLDFKGLIYELHFNNGNVLADTRNFRYKGDTNTAGQREIVITYGENPNADMTAQFTIHVYKREQKFIGTAEYHKTTANQAFYAGVDLLQGDGKLSYRSDDPSVAEVSSDGKIAVKSAGRTVITVTAAETNSYLKSEFQIKITVEKAYQEESLETKTGNGQIGSADTVEDESKETKDLKKGMVIDFGGLKYLVTKAVQTGGTVGVCGLADTRLTKIEVPEKIVAYGKVFQVTTICNRAFQKQNGIAEVVIGANITKIGTGAFEDCTALRYMDVLSKKIRSVGKNAFKNVNPEITIHTVRQKMSFYKRMFRKSGNLSNDIEFTAN